MIREEPLAGGVVTNVVRVGETVRRSTGPWTGAVQALLGHLRDSNFHYAPKPYGTDSAGREILPGRFRLPAVWLQR